MEVHVGRGGRVGRKLEDREGLHFALTGAPHHVDLEGRGQLLAAFCQQPIAPASNHPRAATTHAAGGDAYSAIMHAQPLSAPTPPRSYIHPASVITTRLGGHGKQCDSAQQPGSSKEEGCALQNSKFYLVRLNYY